MPKRTITKLTGLVIFLLGISMLASSCSHASWEQPSEVNASEFSPNYEKPVVIGKIESDDVRESSGITASPCQPNVFWTHNDSGDGPNIFAMNSNGKHLGAWRVTNASNDDWEDIASYRSPDGTCYLYIGDIGNNKADRSKLTIYRVKEPTITPSTRSSDEKNPLSTDPADAAVFKYSDSPHNAETLLVQPRTGDVYVLTKRVDGPSLVFKFRPNFGSPDAVVAEKVGEVALPAVPNGLLTGGSISPDGQRVILCDYTAGYELDIVGKNFDDIWKQRPIPVNLGDRKHGESVTFSSDGQELLGTSEGKNAEVFEVKRK